MLASDEEHASVNALRFSLASEIVELVVLTTDEAFLQTLRKAVGGARRVWHVLSADKVSDLLAAGQVGILVLDVQTLVEAAPVFIAQTKGQFPDLVIVVAGHRDAEIPLAALISTGTVYRFIHKPMSPGRAKSFADAAVKKYDEKRKSTAAASPIGGHPFTKRMLAGCMLGALVALAAASWTLHRRFAEPPGPVQASGANPAAADSPLLAQAAAALAANRLTEPPGDNALELYLRAQDRRSDEQKARAGVAEVRERLLARAENALLEERLDEASAAIDTARKSGAEGGRVAFLATQLEKSRERLKIAQASARARAALKAGADKLASLLDLADQRLANGRLIDPARDNAFFYIREALRLAPHNGAAQEARNQLARRLMHEARGAIDRRDFARASEWIEAAKGIAPAPDVEAFQELLAGARREAAADARTQLLKNATERLKQDRLVEPADDSAKYYLLILRSMEPTGAGLAAAMQELGTRLVAKGRLALALGQYDAARSWLDEAAATGFASAEYNSARHDLGIASSRQKFLSDVVAAGDLTLIKSVKPVYPRKAQLRKTEGWVELDFTVTETGAVSDIAVHDASAPGVFNDAAKNALGQWRYKPVRRDGAIRAQRARIKIRFVLGDSI